MTVSLKDALKFIGIIIIACCAVLVCNMFLNYDIDLRSIGKEVDASAAKLYDALRMNNTVVCSVTGGCLVLTAAVMLVFYIGQYIEAHSARFGVLKALGYSDFKIALPCAVFGFCVFAGAILGYALSWAIIPRFYGSQNSGNNLPEVPLNFHASLLALLVFLPALAFSALSVGIALIKLKAPALALIRGTAHIKYPKKLPKDSDRPFLVQLALNVLKEKKSLAFFIAFGGFCFSAMVQMGLSMKDYASDMMGAMIITIGLVLAATSLWLAFTTLVGGNAKKIAMLKVNGYGLKESGLAVLGLYAIPAFIGFAIGSIYQFALLNIMVNIVFASLGDVPAYSFDWVAFAICLAIFIVAYALLNAVYTVIIGKTPLKSVMSE